MSFYYNLFLRIYLFIYLGTCIHHLLSVFVSVRCMQLCLLIQLSRHKIQLPCYYNQQLTVFVSGNVYGYMFRLMLKIRKPIQNFEVSFITSRKRLFFSGARH